MRLSTDEVASALAELTSDGRGARVGPLGAAVARSARAAGTGTVLRGHWLVDLFLDVAPRIPVRDLETLRRHHRGLDGEELADALIASAARASAGVGAAGGAVAAVSWAAPPAVLVSGPAHIAAETLAVAAVETKLVAELHQVYGVHPQGRATQRGLAYVWAWTTRRGIDPLEPASAVRVVTGPARRAVRNRLAGRAGRNLTTLGPLLSGAVVGSVANHRETTHVGRAVRNDLSRQVRGRASSRASTRRWGLRVDTYQ